MRSICEECPDKVVTDKSFSIILTLPSVSPVTILPSGAKAAAVSPAFEIFSSMRRKSAAVGQETNVFNGAGKAVHFQGRFLQIGDGINFRVIVGRIKDIQSGGYHSFGVGADGNRIHLIGGAAVVCHRRRRVPNSLFISPFKNASVRASGINGAVD